MQHKVFQHAPQSILSAPPYAHHDHHKQSLSIAEASRQRLKRARKPARKIIDAAAPPLSPNAASWGAADDQEVEVTIADDESEDEQEFPVHDHPAASRQAKRRRQYLDPGDVGRFATLKIGQYDNQSKGPSPVSSPKPPLVPASTSAPTPIGEITATSIEEPEDEDDIDMRARRGVTTHQIDSNRFYVTSLSDDSEDEEAQDEQERQDRIDAAIASSSDSARQDGSFVVNGELISRLQRLDSHRRRALARDRSFQRRQKQEGNVEDGEAHTTLASKPQQGALILWKGPKELSKEIQMHQESPIISTQDRSPPVVVEDGDYACVRRPTSPFLFEKTTSTTSPVRSTDEMDIDS